MATTAAPSTRPPLLARLKTYGTPYHLALVGGIGAISAVFGAIIVVLILIATNFNILALIE